MSKDQNQTTGTPVLSESAEDAARLNAAAAHAKKAVAERAARAANQRPEDAREREKDFGGPRLKMHVMGTIEGYHLYWENDQDSAIEQLLYDGFEFVSPDEVSMQRAVVSDGDLSNRVSRYVGTKADGTPLRAYLMKCKNEVWDEREAHRYRQADEWDGAIRQSQQAPRGEGQYVPKGVTNSLNTRARIDLSKQSD
jgi:hypothetical protein